MKIGGSGSRYAQPRRMMIDDAPEQEPALGVWLKRDAADRQAPAWGPTNWWDRIIENLRTYLRGIGGY